MYGDALVPARRNCQCPLFITLADPDESGPVAPDNPGTLQFTRDGELDDQRKSS